MKITLPFLVLLLAGCGTGHDVPVASGPIFQMNPGHWDPGPNELTTASAATKRASP